MSGSGLAWPGRARAQGKRVSRPPIPAAMRRRIEEPWRAGKSINAIRRELKIAYGTAWHYVRALEPAPPPRGEP